MGQYDNFLQFAGQKDGAIRCAQVVQPLLANHVNQDVSNPLVAVQLDASNAFCSILRQCLHYAFQRQSGHHSPSALLQGGAARG